MLLSFPEGDILVDQKPIIRNLRINITPNHQLRAKLEILRDESNCEDPIPVDVVVYDYSYRISSITSVAVVIKGQERNSGVSFNMTLSLNILKRIFSLRGNYGTTTIRETTYSNITDVVKAICTYVQTTVPASIK